MAQLSGMTGFARLSGEAEWGTWAWEAKSVNGRGLDVRVGYPQGFDAFERTAKTETANRMKRGSLQVSLKIELSGGGADIVVNEAALDRLIAAHKKASGEDGVDAASLATLMNVKGIVEVGSSSTRELAGVESVVSVLQAGLEGVLDQLVDSRHAEGDSLKTIILRLVEEMEGQLQSAEKHARTQPAFLKERLERQLTELDTADKIDADRLAAEIALSAAKADVREELDRLSAHLKTAREYLKDGSPVGRKLDFLSQELNREANTLCSKSVDLDLTNTGLALKALVDQFKEQAANVE